MPAYLRKVLPDPDSITDMEVRESFNAVVFRWHGVQFLADPTLRTLEVRDCKLFISNLSILLQTILQRRRKKELLLTGAIRQLHEAERLIWAQEHPRRGIDLLDAVKGTLAEEMRA